MKINWIEKKYSAEETTFIMYCLGIIAGCGILISLFRNLTLCMELGKDDTADYIWKILLENITLLSMIICSVLVCLMIGQVRKKQVFTLFNANVIQAMGLVLEANGIAQYFLRDRMPGADADSQIYMIFMLMGVFFSFISCLFKLGIQMQEEQDLTV